MYVRVPLPKITSELVSNLLGLAGLAGLVVAIAGLAGGWWALLAASVILLGLSWVASTAAAAERKPAPVLDQAQVQQAVTQAVTRALREVAKTRAA